MVGCLEGFKVSKQCNSLVAKVALFYNQQHVTLHDVSKTLTWQTHTRPRARVCVCVYIYIYIGVMESITVAVATNGWVHY